MKVNHGQAEAAVRSKDQRFVLVQPHVTIADKYGGCYQCSQRRINCDRQEPVCGKCAASNIKCGGLSPKRIRFVEDVAAEKDALSRRNRLCGSRNSGGESSQQNSLALRARAAHSSSPQLGLDVLDGESQFLLTYCECVLHWSRLANTSSLQHHRTGNDRHGRFKQWLALPCPSDRAHR